MFSYFDISTPTVILSHLISRDVLVRANRVIIHMGTNGDCYVVMEYVQLFYSRNCYKNIVGNC